MRKSCVPRCWWVAERLDLGSMKATRCDTGCIRPTPGPKPAERPIPLLGNAGGLRASICRQGHFHFATFPSAGRGRARPRGSIRPAITCLRLRSSLYRARRPPRSAMRSLRLSVRTSDFQSEKTGSTPVGSAIEIIRDSWTLLFHFDSLHPPPFRLSSPFRSLRPTGGASSPR